MEVTVELIRTLREQTGAGIMDCKVALVDNGGDLDKATNALREKGITVLIVEQNARLSLSRSDRGYIFSNGKVVHTAPASEILVDPQINEYFLGTKKD